MEGEHLDASERMIVSPAAGVYTAGDKSHGPISAGATIGFGMGLASALGSIPLSVKNPKAGALSDAGEREPDRLPLTLGNSPGTARGLTIAGFALPVALLFACVLLLLHP